MTGVKSRTIGTAAVAVVLLSALAAGAALSQAPAPAGTPPPWSTLVRCAEMANDDAALACFKAAMREAGFAPKPEAVAAEHRHSFGLSLPQIGALRHRAKQEGSAAAGREAAPAEVDEDEVTVTLSQVASLYDGKLLFITADGGIWEQTDDTVIGSRPKAGYQMKIHKGKFGGFFCDPNAYKSVRCERTH
jgi:hypothetical protein